MMCRETVTSFSLSIIRLMVYSQMCPCSLIILPCTLYLHVHTDAYYIICMYNVTSKVALIGIATNRMYGEHRVCCMTMDKAQQ